MSSKKRKAESGEEGSDTEVPNNKKERVVEDEEGNNKEKEEEEEGDKEKGGDAAVVSVDGAAGPSAAESDDEETTATDASDGNRNKTGPDTNDEVENTERKKFTEIIVAGNTVRLLIQLIESRIPLVENCGTLLFCGGTNWDQLGRKRSNTKPERNLYGPHRLQALKGIRVRKAISGNSASHNVIITEDGKVMTWGRNDKGQLGHGDTKRKDNPAYVEGLQDFVAVDAACGRSHTLVLTDHGHVYSFGDNKNGQCGIGSNSPLVTSPHKIAYKGRPIVKLSCGGEFSMIVDAKGNVCSFGCPEYGQLGHNTDGRYFVTSNRLAYRCELVPRRIMIYVERTREGHVIPVDDVHIVSISCGPNHTVAMDSKKRCYSWGFGGYGRLGHSEPKDEMVPRLIKFFDGPNRGIKGVGAGSTYSLAVNEHACLYFWGQTKMAGDATMYPKPVHDLTGWKVRALGCSNKSIVVLADESVVSWGPSPTYGELGYGENKMKSSTTPQEVKPLDGIHIYDVSCGFGHTLFVARDTSEEDKAKLNKLPEFSP